MPEFDPQSFRAGTEEDTSVDCSERPEIDLLEARTNHLTAERRLGEAALQLTQGDQPISPPENFRIGSKRVRLDAELRDASLAQFLNPHTALDGIRLLFVGLQKRRSDLAISKFAHVTICALDDNPDFATLPADVAQKAQQTLTAAFYFTRFSLRTDRLPSWGDTSEEERFRILADHYMPDVKAFYQMGLDVPAQCAITMSAQECQDLLDTYGHLMFGRQKTILNQIDCRARLERLATRVEWAREYYKNTPLVCDSEIKKAAVVSFSIANDEIFKQKLEALIDRKHQRREAIRKTRETRFNEKLQHVEVAKEHYKNKPPLWDKVIEKISHQIKPEMSAANLEKAIEDYVARYQQIQECTAALLLPDCAMKRLALQFGMKPDDIEKLQEALAQLKIVSKKYNLKREQIAYCVTQYKLDGANLESKLQRYKSNLRMMAPLLQDADIPRNYVMYWAFYQSSNPTMHIKRYLDRLAFLRHSFGADEAFDDLALRKLATRDTRDIEERALEYKVLYTRLKEEFADDDYIEDWMIRTAATAYKKQYNKLYRLRHGMQRGYFRLSLDRPAQDDGTVTFHELVSDTTSPEEEYVENQSALDRRVRIQGAIQTLSLPERRALSYAFGLDWLVEAERIELSDVCEQLGIPTADFDEHLKHAIIPKIDAEQLEGLQ